MKFRGGCTGRLLRVDLTRGNVKIELSAPYTGEYIGGRGIASPVLFHEIDPPLGPFDEGNKVVLGAGPLVGTIIPASARLSVDHMNANTGGLGSSNGGGHFAPELKYAGFDAIIIEGKSPKPVYLYVHNGKAHLLDAQFLWGLVTGRTEAAIRKHLNEPDLRIASIGPAGENCVVGGCLIIDGARAAGRSGAGAVLGSKRLKAIAIRGTMPVKVFDPKGLFEASQEIKTLLDRISIVRIMKERGLHGLASGAAGSDLEYVIASVRNCQDESWPVSKLAKIQEQLLRKYHIRHMGCFNCSEMSCAQLYRLPESVYGVDISEGVPANAVNGFAANLDVTSPESLLLTYAACNQLGIDIDMASTLVAWAMELAENRLLPGKEIQSLGLHWGNPLAARKLIHLIAHRKGIGNLFADGIQAGVEKMGETSAKHAVHIKGASLNESDLRVDPGYALGIMVSVRGGGHLDGATTMGQQNISPEQSTALFGMSTAGDQSAYNGRGIVVMAIESLKAVVDMLGLCYFTSYWNDIELLKADDYARLLYLATGVVKTGDELLAIGRRLHNVEKAFSTLH
ncbi:MAG: hypothetical protein JXA42_06405, partial [Anaerolineales bacterium]|nr:hypothetical protein [Anaerolineales bacterium]